ncbi:MAG: sugar transferase [Syntrophorhabdales bacterium]|jgi:exopolysaccharide biosynthesis polyprenyl glycosylphosphotransferase
MPILSFLQNSKAAERRGHRGPEDHALRDDRTGLYHAEYFNELLTLERRRCERSHDSVLLMCADLKAFGDASDRREIAAAVMRIFSRVTRETDIKGWHVRGTVVGIMFTQLSEQGKNRKATVQRIINKCSDSLGASSDLERLSNVHISWHAYPEEFLEASTGSRSEGISGTGKGETSRRRRLSLWTKRLIDIAGSLTAMILLSPAFLAIAALVKLDSEGPVFFRQERIGLGGKKFVFLKFRSMCVNNDPGIHKAYVTGLIRASKNNGANGEKGPRDTYKIKDDPRVTSLGKVLRKTSLDELPQFINVLKGDMSLVGPRPPILYECQNYDLWHRRRVMEMKPGITGLWQVEGRSALPFDDAVRMDIKYVREWSLWMDLMIIFKTPLAVLTCKGAY